jgi:hypothetical protein
VDDEVDERMSVLTLMLGLRGALDGPGSVSSISALVLENEESCRGRVRSPADVDGRSISVARSIDSDGGREYCAVPSGAMIIPGGGMGGYGCRLRSSGDGIVSVHIGGIGPAVLGSEYDGDDTDEGVLTDERSLIVRLRRMELLPLDRLLSGRYSRVRTLLLSLIRTRPVGVRSVEGVTSTN